MLCYKESKVDAKFRKSESRSVGIWFEAAKRTLDLMAGIAVRLLKRSETARQRPQTVEYSGARASAGFRWEYNSFIKIKM